MIKEIFLFANGAVACTDENGKQVVEWQGNLFCSHLLKMREAGAVTNDTRVTSAIGDINSYRTVGDWIGRPLKGEEKND